MEGINSQIYAKVYGIHENSPHPTRESPQVSEFFIRNSDDNSKLFAIFPPNPEMVLYDFTLSVNDTFSFGFYGKCIVDSTDTVVLGGSVRKRMYCSSISPDTSYLYFYPIVLISGIGNLGGLTPRISQYDPITADYKEYYLRCMVDNGDLIYHDGNITDSCPELYTSIKQVSYDRSIKIFPVPSKDYLEISTEYDYTEFEIVDLRGLILKSGSFSEKILVGDLSPGYYILRLKNLNKNLYAIRPILIE